MSLSIKEYKLRILIWIITILLREIILDIADEFEEDYISDEDFGLEPNYSDFDFDDTDYHYNSD